MASPGELEEILHNRDQSGLRQLLHEGLDPNLKINGVPVLMLAIELKSLPLVEALLEHGADPHGTWRGIDAFDLVGVDGWPRTRELLAMHGGEGV